MATDINLQSATDLLITGITSVSISDGVVSFTIPSTVPGGLIGDIQYNNGGVFGGSATTITAGGSIVMPTGQTLNLPTTSSAPSLTFGANQPSAGLGSTSQNELDIYGDSVVFYTSGGSATACGELIVQTNEFGIAALTDNASFLLIGQVDTTTTNAGIALQAAQPGFNAASGTQIGVNIGGDSFGSDINFQSGTANYLELMVQPHLQSTSTGIITVAGIYPYISSVGGLTRLLGLGTSSTQGNAAVLTDLFTVDLSGNVSVITPVGSVVANSPTLTIFGVYEVTAGPTYAKDSWTVQLIEGAGVNGSSELKILHTPGTTGVAMVEVSQIVVGAKPTGGLGFDGTKATNAIFPACFGAINSATFAFVPSSSTSVNVGMAIRFYTAAGVVTPASTWGIGINPNNGGHALLGFDAQLGQPGQHFYVASAMGSTAGAGILFGGNGGNNGVDFSATSGVQYGVMIGADPTGQSNTRVTFKPASGTAKFVGLNINPTINQTGSASGSYTGLQVNVVETALLGTANKLLDLQAGATGGTSKFSVDNTGTMHATAGQVVAYNSQSGSYALLSTDYAVAFTATATATLNSALPKGTSYRIKLKGTGLTLTVTPTAGLIDDAATAVITTNNAAIDVIFDGTNWEIF